MVGGGNASGFSLTPPWSRLQLLLDRDLVLDQLDQALRFRVARFGTAAVRRWGERMRLASVTPPTISPVTIGEAICRIWQRWAREVNAAPAAWLDW
jgi:phage baseplate assembly protein W